MPLIEREIKDWYIILFLQSLRKYIYAYISVHFKAISEMDNAEGHNLYYSDIVEFIYYFEKNEKDWKQ